MNNDRRKYPRLKTDNRIKLVTEDFQISFGYVQDMSIGGLYISMESTDRFAKNTLVDASIIGISWDPHLPDLLMEITRVDKGGIALRYAAPNESYHAFSENHHSALMSAVAPG